MDSEKNNRKKSMKDKRVQQEGEKGGRKKNNYDYSSVYI